MRNWGSAACLAMPRPERFADPVESSVWVGRDEIGTPSELSKVTEALEYVLRPGVTNCKDVQFVGVQTAWRATRLEARIRIGPAPQGPPVNASKFWICSVPLSAFTHRQVG